MAERQEPAILNDPADTITLLVLCGGAGARMGGADKPLEDWLGQPMVDRVLDACPPGVRRLISANRSVPQYRRRGEVFTDDEVGVQTRSPLTGILGGLLRTETDWLLVTPGDTPCLSADWWRPLWQALRNTSPETEGPDGAVVHDGQRRQNLHLLLRRTTAPSLHGYLNAGRHEVWGWLDQLRLIEVAAADPAMFHNVNRPDDLPRPGHPAERPEDHEPGDKQGPGSTSSQSRI